jgi:hypothetical protein
VVCPHTDPFTDTLPCVSVASNVAFAVKLIGHDPAFPWLLLNERFPLYVDDTVVDEALVVMEMTSFIVPSTVHTCPAVDVDLHAAYAIVPDTPLVVTD